MRALVHAAFGDDKIPDCSRCEGDTVLRRRFGCDSPADRPVFYISCGSCGGRGCQACEDSGGKPMYRCPGRLVDGHPQVRRAFEYCVQHERSGVLPAAGGLADQSCTFVEALRIYQHERALIDRDRRDAEERERKREAAKAHRG